MTDIIEIPAIKLTQNIGDIYAAVMQARDLFDIAEVDRIELQKLEVPKYAGYQRALATHRVSSIQDYLTTPRSTFPNAIICSLDSEYILDWDEVNPELGLSKITIERNSGAVHIIDGQHRAAALDAAGEDFQVLVSLFVDLNVVLSAEIFAKINSTQMAVNPSIAFQLFGYSEDRSPQKTAHDIADLMNSTDGSPFYRQLRMLGTRDAWTLGTLSQSTFAKQLMRLYTRKPEEDQNALLRGEDLKTYPGYPLRSIFIDGEDDHIMQVLWRYFFHVAETWSEQWIDESGNSILTKTTGYSAFIQVLRHWLLSNRAEEVLMDHDVDLSFSAIRNKYQEQNMMFIRDNYESGNVGIRELRNSLIEDLALEP